MLLTSSALKAGTKDPYLTMGTGYFELQPERTFTNNDLDDEAQRPRKATGLSNVQPVLRTRRRSQWIIFHVRRYFVSSVANGASTGVYRHHTVRMDSPAKCFRGQSFRRNCKGEMPFKTLFAGEKLNVNTCVELLGIY